MGRVFPAEFVTIKYSYFLEPTMLELLKSLVFAVVMVPVVMAIILGLIYGLGEVFNLFSGAGQVNLLQQGDTTGIGEQALL